MQYKNQQRFISMARLKSYSDFNQYRQNIYLSKKYYILLSILEVSLRNSIDFYFSRKFTSNWLESKVLHTDTLTRVNDAKQKILNRKESLTHDKILSELPFGFWTSLFRKSYMNIFRLKDINQIFLNLPNKDELLVTRNVLDKKLNHIRKFRNRIFHYEKVIDKEEYKNIENEIYTILDYMEHDIYLFAKEMMNDN